MLHYSAFGANIIGFCSFLFSDAMLVSKTLVLFVDVSLVLFCG